MGGTCCCYSPPPELVVFRFLPPAGPPAPILLRNHPPADLGVFRRPAPAVPVSPVALGVIPRPPPIAPPKWVARFNQRRGVAVDDYRDWLVGVASTLGLLKELALIIREYVGCIACPDPLHHEYRRVVFGFDYKQNDEIDKLMPCHTLIFQDPRGLQFCSYCGLSLWHHRNNREPVKSDLIYGDQKHVDPMVFYCNNRCPIHPCSMCARPFVKTKETHLCVSCTVEWLKQPLFKRLYRPIDTNRYQDELTVCGVWATVRGSTHYGQRARVVHRQGRRRSIMESYEYVDYSEVFQIIAKFLRHTERICPICRQSFRYPSNDLTRDVVRDGVPAVLCGFCSV